jgi:Carboxypeptidase regulatory-like domain
MESAVRPALTRIFLGVLTLALICALPVFSAAQATSGVTGVVTDESGALLVGAQVTLTNPATAFSAATTTDSNGAYKFLHIPPATYTLTFSQDKFRTVTISNVELGVSVVETRNAKLPVGSKAERVEVTASGEGTINTVDSSIGNVITTQQVQDLPSLLRDDVTAVLQLQPGVQQTSSGVGDSQYGSVTGSRADAGTVTLDGLDVNDETIGTPFAAVGRAPVDSISEVRTIVGGADVSFGRGAGAQVDLVTQSGTNSWHGTLEEFNRVSAEAANDYFNNLNGVPKAQLTRNQYGGSIGGPIKKDKAFFFFDYSARRQAQGEQQTLTVPLDPFRAGELSYVNTSGVISTVPALGTPGSNSVQGLDPQGVGANQPFLSFLSGRPYPEPNDFSAGDGINTGGYLFTAPAYIRANTFVGRLDYTLSSHHNLFARGTWDRDSDTQTPKAFPTDAGPVGFFVNHERSWVVADTWTINTSMVNLASFGLTRQVDAFPINLSSAANIPVPNIFGFGVLSGPYGDIRGQGRNVPVPEIRDNFNWSRGKHNLQFGADIKPIRVHSSLTNDVNFPSIGLQSELTSLSPGQRPSDISSDPGLQNLWDNAFTTILGRYASTTAQYNYQVAGTAYPQYSPSLRNFNYNEFEFFAQDSWKVRSDLTFSYGLRWNYHSVPYEAGGFESVANIFEPQLFNARQQAAASGINGFTAAPFLTYQLGGPANHGPNYYHPDWKDFSPRIGIAYSPSFTHGVLGHLLGDRKTSIRAGGGIAYDRVLSTLSFEIDESSELFSTSTTQEFGIPNDPVDSLLNDPRFTSIGAPPPPPPPGVGPGSPTIPRPFTPFVTPSNGNNCPVASGFYGADVFVPAGQPCAVGLYNNQDLFQLNNTLKMPYSMSVSFGFQRELPKNFILEVSYFGKFGRRLIGSADPAQQLNFVDSASGQSLNNAFGNVQNALCATTGPGQVCNPSAGTPIGSIPTQPWFENQVNAALSSVTGETCLQVFGLNCTNLAADFLPNNFEIGDLSTVDVELANAGLLLPNTGLPYQTGSVANVGNFASSNYHSLIVTLRKKYSNNLYFDFDYAYAHSIDNVSDITNDAVFASFNAQGLICDLRNLRTCRASSDFDSRQTVSANYEYQLPVGRGQQFLASAPRWVDEILGGWGTSGIVSFHTGYPWSTVTNAFPINFTQLGPAVFIGPSSSVKEHIHVEATASGAPGLQLFANQQNALGAFTHPWGGGTGERNTLRGPGYFNADMALLKIFKISEGKTLQFRAEAFNAFNHPSFNAPQVNPNNAGSLSSANTNIDSSLQYGFLNSTANTARELSLGLLFRF